MKKKRILAMILSAAMVLTAVPVSVFAEEADALIGEDEVLVEEAAPVEEAVEPVEAAPEAAPEEEAAPADKLIAEDEAVAEATEEAAAPAEDEDVEFIDIVEDEEGNEADAELGAGPYNQDDVGLEVGRESYGIKNPSKGSIGTDLAGEIRLQTGEYVEKTFDPFDEESTHLANVKVFVKDRTEKLTEGTDYTLDWSGAKHAGTACVKIKFDVSDVYKNINPINIYYNVGQYDLDDDEYEKNSNVVWKGTKTYNGSRQLPDGFKVELEHGGVKKELFEGQDFVFDWQDKREPIGAGGYLFNIIGKGDYKGRWFIGDANVLFTIEPKTLTSGDVSVASGTTFYYYKTIGDRVLDNLDTVTDGSLVIDGVEYTSVSEYLWDHVIDNWSGEPIPRNHFNLRYEKIGGTTAENNTFWGNIKVPGSGEVQYENMLKYVGDYKYYVEFISSENPNFKHAPGSSKEIEGTYSLRLYPPVDNLQEQLQDLIDKESIDPDYDLIYNGKDRRTDVESYLKNKLYETWGIDPTLVKVEFADDEIINANSYQVTLTDRFVDSTWAKEPIVVDVTIARKNLIEYNSRSNPSSFNNGVYDISVLQWQYSTGEWYVPAEVLSIKDREILGADGKPSKLVVEKDYTVTFKYDTTGTGNNKNKVKTVLITGNGNYKSSIVKEDANHVWSETSRAAEYTGASGNIDPVGQNSLQAPFIDISFDKTFTYKDVANGGGQMNQVITDDVIVTEDLPSGKRTLSKAEYTIFGYDCPTDKTGIYLQNTKIPTSAGTHTFILRGQKPWREWSDTSDDNVYGLSDPKSFVVTSNDPIANEFKLKSDTLENAVVYENTVPPVPIVERNTSTADVSIVSFVYKYYHEENGTEIFDGEISDVANDFSANKENVVKPIKFDEVGPHYVKVTINREEAPKLDYVDDSTPLVASFNVVQRDLSDAKKVDVTSASSVVWPGQNVSVANVNLSLYDKGRQKYLKLDKDYTAVVNQPDQVGKTTVTVTGIGDYTGTKDVNLTIEAQTLTSDGTTIKVKVKNQPYAGGHTYNISSDDVEVNVEHDGNGAVQNGVMKVIPADDYVVTFASQTLKVGQSYKVTVSAAEGGHYKDQIVSNDDNKVTIENANISNTKYFEIVPIEDQEYTGSEIRPAVTLQYKMGGLSDEDKVVNPDVYTVDYADNTEVGTAKVRIEAVADSGFTGEADTTFNITKIASVFNAEIAPAEITVGGTAKITTSGAIGAVKYSVAGEGAVSIAEDGTVTGTKAGDVVITASDPGDNNHEGKDVELNLKVTAAKEALEGFTATVVGAPFVYTGKEQKPKVNVTKGTTSLTEGTDYDVTYADNTNAGTATFTVTGKGNYEGTITGTFTIEKAKNAITLKAKSATKYYDTKAVTTTKLAGAKATSGAVTYAISNSALTINASTGAITIPATFMGRATVTVKSAANPNYEDASATCELVVQPKKVKLLSAHNNKKNGKYKVKLTWEKAPDRSGYVVKYSKDSTFKTGAKYVWVKKEEATSARFIQQMKKGETYYFKVKVYKNIPGQKKVTSEYSNTKKLTIK